MAEKQELTSAMDNVYASRLGRIADVAAAQKAGDSIDRGLILLRLLKQNGFTVLADQPVMQLPRFNDDLSTTTPKAGE